MDAVLVLCRCGLAVVFLTAGVSKVRDRTGTRVAVTQFGVSSSAAAPLAVLLPIVELGVGVGVLAATTAVVAATVAVGLLAAFSVTAAANLAGGRRPDCHCFGQLHSAPVGWRTLVRNGVLLALALVVVAGNGGPPVL